MHSVAALMKPGFKHTHDSSVLSARQRPYYVQAGRDIQGRAPAHGGALIEARQRTRGEATWGRDGCAARARLWLGAREGGEQYE